MLLRFPHEAFTGWGMHACMDSNRLTISCMQSGCCVRSGVFIRGDLVSFFLSFFFEKRIVGLWEKCKCSWSYIPTYLFISLPRYLATSLPPYV